MSRVAPSGPTSSTSAASSSKVSTTAPAVPATRRPYGRRRATASSSRIILVITSSMRHPGDPRKDRHTRSSDAAARRRTEGSNRFAPAQSDRCAPEPRRVARTNRPTASYTPFSTSSSKATLIGAAGLPILDGLGAVGDGAHARHSRSERDSRGKPGWRRSRSGGLASRRPVRESRSLVPITTCGRCRIARQGSRREHGGSRYAGTACTFGCASSAGVRRALAVRRVHRLGAYARCAA